MLEILGDRLDAAAVELMVSGDVDHRPFEAQGPGHRLTVSRDVASQHDHVGVVLRTVHRTEAQVQVGEDVELHASLAAHLNRPTASLASRCTMSRAGSIPSIRSTPSPAHTTATSWSAACTADAYTCC